MSDNLDKLTIDSSDLGKWPKLAMVAGAVGIVLTLAILLLASDKALFFRSYMVGFIFWFNIAAGCLFWLMVPHLTGGAWGVMIRRIVEAGARTVVWSLIFLLPVILFGMPYLYEWTHADVVKNDAVLQAKSGYLNIPAYLGRLAVCGLVWGGLAYRLSGLSAKQDKGVDPKLSISMKRWSGGGLLLLLLTMTFAAVDWLLSMEPHFSSAMYGAALLTGQALASMSFIVALLVVLVAREPMRSRLTSGHVHDLGNFLLAATLFWAYINFSQFLIIWGANVAEQVPYYLRRMTGWWGVVGMGIIAFHFFAPFFLLLNRRLKQNIHVLVRVAYWILFLRFVEICWLIIPSNSHSNYGSEVYPMGIVVAVISVIGIGGLWLLLFFKFLVKRPLLPKNDPYLQEALEFRGGH